MSDASAPPQWSAGREVLELLYTIGRGGVPPWSPPPHPDQSGHSGKKRNLPLGKSGWALFGPQTFGSHPPLLCSHTSLSAGTICGSKSLQGASLGGCVGLGLHFLDAFCGKEMRFAISPHCRHVVDAKRQY